MTAYLSRVRQHFANWRDWELNPIVVKELRQTVRSRAVTGTLMMFLLVLFCAALMFFVTQSFDDSTDQRLGAGIFFYFLLVLTSASVFFIPIYIGVRVAMERTENDLDLLYISTLSPSRIIRGKFLCGAYVAVLFFSACMPFMTFTNLLRGVDLPSVFFALLCVFLIVCCLVQAAIFIACLPISRLLKILILLFALPVKGYFVAGITMGISEMMMQGVGSMMSRSSFWEGFFTISGVVLAAALLLYFLSVALVTPPSANRAPPVRIYMTAFWLISGLISIVWVAKQKEPRLILPWAIISIVLFSLSLVVTVSNSDTLSLRVQRTIPERLPRRAIAFLFYNGAAGGLVWTALIFAATFAVLWKTLLSGTSVSVMDKEDFDAIMYTSAAAIFYVFDYALVGLFLHRKLLPRRSPRFAGIFAVIVPAAWAVIPVLIFFFLNRLSTRDLEHIQLGNIFNIFVVGVNAQKEEHLIFAAGWLCVMLLLNLSWFIKRLKSFQPLRRTKASTATMDAPPIIPAAVS